MSKRNVFDRNPNQDQRWIDWARDIERLSSEEGWNIRQLTEENPTRVQLRNDVYANPVEQEAIRRNFDMRRVEVMQRIYEGFPSSWRIAVALRYLDGREPGTIADRLRMDHRHIGPMFELIFRETSILVGIHERRKVVQGDELTHCRNHDIKLSA